MEEKTSEHVGRKIIPSGFFSLPKSENVSALLFSNAGTVAKFSRMGFVRNPAKGMVMCRWGTEYDKDPTAIMPKPFAYMVGDYSENWADEAVILHNPHAKYPLPEHFFGTTAECNFRDGKLEFFAYGDYFYAGVTQKLLSPQGQEAIYRHHLGQSPRDGSSK